MLVLSRNLHTANGGKGKAIIFVESGQKEGLHVTPYCEIEFIQKKVVEPQTITTKVKKVKLRKGDGREFAE